MAALLGNILASGDHLPGINHAAVARTKGYDFNADGRQTRRRA